MVEFLDENIDIFLGWQCDCPQRSTANEYDSAIYKLRNILREYSLIGYHCTKLTEEEIINILEKGMHLQNGSSLRERIYRLEAASIINSEVANALTKKNKADCKNRANSLWFCFFEPFLAGQCGIGRFFKSWGGEALYISHEDDSLTGKVLCSIGIPCIVKAKVPIVALKDSFYPDTVMIRGYLSRRNHYIDNSLEHEAFSIKNIESQNILNIFKYPSNEFIELTKYDSWGR